MSEKILRDVWSVNNDPADILRSDVVSVPQQAAFSTVEAFTITISFGDVPTIWTCSARVPWVNVDYGDSHNFSLVFNKTLELMESPRMECSSLAATSNRYPSANTLEVFKSYSLKGVLSFLNNPFGYCVINGGDEPMFFFPSFLEQTLSRFCSFSLEFASDFHISASYSIEFFANPSFAVAVGCYVFNPNIHAQEIFRRERFCFGNFDGCSKIEYVISEDKVGLSTDFVHSSFLIFAYQHGNLLSSVECQNAYGFKPFPAQNSLVVDHCSVQVKGCLNFFVNLVGVCNFADGSHRHLRREFEVFSDFMVNKVMELPIIKSLSSESGFSDVVTSYIESLHSFFEKFELEFCWNKFNRKCLLHNYMDRHTPYLTFVAPIPPLNEFRGFLGGL